jgi:hypothetical protein
MIIQSGDKPFQLFARQVRESADAAQSFDAVGNRIIRLGFDRRHNVRRRNGHADAFDHLLGHFI